MDICFLWFLIKNKFTNFFFDNHVEVTNYGLKSFIYLFFPFEATIFYRVN